jgi:hypothetical protein
LHGLDYPTTKVKTHGDAEIHDVEMDGSSHPEDNTRKAAPTFLTSFLPRSMSSSKEEDMRSVGAFGERMEVASVTI